MRATFPQFVVKLKLSPQSGKTFNDNSTKRKPLSAQGATLPEAERQKVRALCRLGISENGCKRKPLSAQGVTLPEGESFSTEREDKRYVSFNLPSGKAISPDSDLKQARYVTINYNKLQIFTKVGL